MLFLIPFVPRIIMLLWLSYFLALALIPFAVYDWIGRPIH